MGRKFEVRKVAMMKSGLHKTKLYSRFGKEIYMCAKQGGVNPEANLSLKHLIERAKKQQVPLDVIKRNIDKASQGTGEDYTFVRYEGFGPGGCSFIVDTLTDNVNRTVSDVRSCFTKIGAKLGVKGSVEHNYQHLSFVTVTGLTSEEVLEHLLESDINIIDIEEIDNSIEITAGGFDIDLVETTMRKISHIEIIASETGWYPQEWVTLIEADFEKYEKFMSIINEIDDVQNVYHNVLE